MKSGKDDAAKVKSVKDPLPVHSLDKREFSVHVQDIEYKNPYDFTREHRHDYFEILFFETGGGSQLIDFMELPVIGSSCYIVFPLQVHLLNRGPDACGKLVQFREEVVPSAQIKTLLRQVSFGENPSVLFENNIQKLEQLRPIIQLLKQESEKTTGFSQEITIHYLQALLLLLIEGRESTPGGNVSDERQLLFEFQHFLEEQYLENHSVQQYAALLNTTEKKLSTITKKYLGMNPLQVIHNRLLLEAKRILLFEDTSHKEIAFRLGFDSPASFSQFIKNKTGSSPSELHAHLVNIHK
ncbi:MAG: helix-turn-helix transcriptional regulator [Bacteroidota bacterium]|nr:helix-turn-helix transcriptional regulator [Bacteroidota bacterium]